MDRRSFIQGALLGAAGITTVGLDRNRIGRPTCLTRSANLEIRGLSLHELAVDYRHRLFDEYLPFWEIAGYDDELGGFMCYLHDDGAVQDDRKDIWYQGRGVWVYSFLYNHLDRNLKWLDMATKSADFMIEHMHNGDGTWIDTVDRVGEPTSVLDMSRGGNIYGALFAAVGLIQLAKATSSEAYLDLARSTIRKSVDRYEDASYPGVVLAGSAATGLRAQGHSFMFVWMLPQLLELDNDPEFKVLTEQHLELVAERFWNPQYGISNEILAHDYSRIPGQDIRMVPGHSIETQWMAMDTAQKLGRDDLASVFRARMRRLTEMSWDYHFGGIGDLDYHVEATGAVKAGPDFSVKAMWAQSEVLVGMLHAFADTGELWAKEWYELMWSYLDRTMTTDHGVWRQAVNRQGEPIERPGISPFRKGNFHQPRCLMMNLLQVERMIQR